MESGHFSCLNIDADADFSKHMLASYFSSWGLLDESGKYSETCVKITL